MLAVTVVCGEDDGQAERMAAPIRLAVVRNRTGRRAPIASVEEALAYSFSAEEQAIADDFLLGAIIGGPQRVVEGLERLAAETQADELMLSTLIGDRDDRRRSYERVAAVAGLTAS
jgi:alkanesulfonate monooxygenase SsuD/methylene tetrahydromethanopterin reductase-like flavin-dependent oxidoreductase (luciferase family)